MCEREKKRNGITAAEQSDRIYEERKRGERVERKGK
jgi:hypothetical protein